MVFLSICHYLSKVRLFPVIYLMVWIFNHEILEHKRYYTIKSSQQSSLNCGLSVSFSFFFLSHIPSSYLPFLFFLSPHTTIPLPFPLFSLPLSRVFPSSRCDSAAKSTQLRWHEYASSSARRRTFVGAMMACICSSIFLPLHLFLLLPSQIH